MHRSNSARTVSRITFLKVAALIVSAAGILGLLQGCQGAAPAASLEPALAATNKPAPVTPKPAVATATAATAAGGDIRVLWDRPTSLNPLFTPAGYQHQVTRLALGSLFKLNDQSVPTPELAERWDISPDSKVYTFYLHEDVQWSDGQQLTAEDMIFTIERAVDKRTGSWRSGQLMNIEGAEAYSEQTVDHITGLEALDDHTVRVTLVEPDAAFMTTIGMWAGFSVLPEHLLGEVPPEQLKDHEFSLAPTVGAGAYQFVAYETDQYAELRSNPSYFAGRPAPDRIFMMILSPDVAVAQLQRGELDLMELPAAEADRLRSDPNVKVISTESPSISQLIVNTERPYFQDKRVRQAIAYAIDRQGIVDSVFFGEAQVVNSSIIGPSWVGEPELKPYPYDPDKARQLLAQAGWDPDQQVEIIYEAGSKQQDAYAPIIQQQLREVGLQVDLQTVEESEWIGRMVDHDYDLSFLRGGQYRAEPSLSAVYYHSKNIPPAGGNLTYYVNPELDQLFDAGVATSNPDERREIYQQIARILNEDLPTVFLWSPNSIYGVSRRLEGFEPPAYSGSLLWNAEAWSVNE